ncbi:hypothetical protein [Niabella ginsengisoli]|uniref:GLPGLI family protein n=1 Tax=Niabella ginsengisoli TaxID=522298 RepID=A0ABS9SJV7_9BACT|nr:hypothetical protein [Niabella ginsengisoli]MCH5598643.1 hypothetical protein [Niabella ginsengisoli]
MKKTFIFLIATLFAITSFGQTFEGKIIYKNTYKSKMPNVTDDQFTAMMGSIQEYFIKKATINQLQMAHFFSGNFM